MMRRLLKDPIGWVILLFLAIGMLGVLIGTLRDVDDSRQSPTKVDVTPMTTRTTSASPIVDDIPEVSSTSIVRAQQVKKTTTTSTTAAPRPAELEARIPDSDAEIAYCEATNQPIQTCVMPETAGMGEDR